eukprot:UN22777
MEEPDSAIEVGDDGKVKINLDKIIMEESCQNYWNQFEKQLETGDFARLYELLSEMKKRLKALLPERAHAKLNEEIDVQFIRTMIERSQFDGEMFYSLFLGLWGQIRGVQPPNDDVNWMKWREFIETKIRDGESWTKVVPNGKFAFHQKMKLFFIGILSV